jgi:hypothetical protein
MAKTLQLRRGSTSDLSAVTGSVGELFVDTTKDTVVVMDGSTAGGSPLATESYADTKAGTAYSNAVSYAGTIAGTAYSNAVSTASADATTKAGTAYSNAIAYAANATNISSGTVATARLGSGTANSTTYLAGDNTWKTVSGSSGSTGDFTFSANEISLPDFTDGVINVVGNVSTLIDVAISTAGESFSAAWKVSHIHDVNSERVVVSKNTTETTEPTGTVPDWVNSFSAGDTLTVVIDGTTETVVLPEAFSYTNMSDGFGGRIHVYEVELDPNPVAGPSVTYFANFDMSMEILDASASYTSTTPTDYSYTFSQTGEFISDSSLIGDVLITDDIITPVAYDSYGESANGTLTINGSLDVTSNVTIDGDLTVAGTIAGVQGLSFDSTIVPNPTDRAEAFSTGAILEVNKKYHIVGNFGSTRHVILPDPTVLSSGDTVEVFYSDRLGFGDLRVWCHGDRTGDESAGEEVIIKPSYVNVGSGVEPGNDGTYEYMPMESSGMKLTFVLDVKAAIPNLDYGNYTWYVVY